MPTYSHSKLGTFEHCRYKYKLKYIDRVKVDIPTTVEAFMGSIVHQCLHKLYRDLQFQKLNSKEELLIFYDEAWAREWSDEILIVKEDYSPENYKAMGRKFLFDYYDHYLPFSHTTTLGLETQDTLKLENGNSYHVRIDRLACDKDGHYYVVDYKTNSRIKQQDELDEDRQLAMYSIWVRQKFPDYRSVKLAWHFLAFDKEMVSERTEEQLRKLKGEVEAIIKEIEGCREYPTTVGPLCDWCEFKSICPAFKHEAELEFKSADELKLDHGVQLVDKYATLHYTIAELEKELNEIREQLIQFSQSKGLEMVYGSNRRISIKPYESISLPPKAEREELNALVKNAGMWEKLSDLDIYKLKQMVKEESLPASLQKKIEDFIVREQNYRLSLGKIKE